MFQLNRGRFGKRGIAMILCTGLVLGCLSGCGGRYAGVGRGDGVSGSAVSESAVSDPTAEDGNTDGKTDGNTDGKAVSGSAVQVKQNPESYPYCTDTNLYYEEDEIIWQSRLDGTHKKRLVEGEWSEKVLWVRRVDEDWLYYEVAIDKDEDVETDKDMLYRAPIRKDKDGYDVVRIAEAEKLITEEGTMYPVESCGTDSPYFFYTIGSTFVKYDLKKKKKILLKSDEDVGAADLYRIGDRYIIFSRDSGIYTLDEDGTQIKKISNDDFYDYMEIEQVQGEKAVYYVENPAGKLIGAVKRCDGEKAADFVTKEQQRDVIVEALNINTDTFDMYADVSNMNCLFYQNGRIYIQWDFVWNDKDGLCHTEYIILSKGEEKDSKLRYEKELTECMKSHAKSRRGTWSHIPEEYSDFSVINDAQCIAMADGKAYLSIHDYEKNKGRLGCYGLADGEFQWVEKGDALFYRLGYEQNLGNFSVVFKSIEDKEADKYTENGYSGFYHVSDDSFGEFVENP